LSGVAREAAIYDCVEKWDRVFACVEKNISCKESDNGRLRFDLPRDSEGESVCVVEMRQYSECKDFARSSDD
jgi:hypothetical protein